MDLKGKKVLILGASELERLIVERAKEWGLFTIVTDYNKNWEDSPAKYAADEAWDVSWSDLVQLELLCRKSGVDGVVAGFSEFRVDNAIALCERLNLPFYASKEQLELTRSKDKFKECCRSFGVPTVPAYEWIRTEEDIDAAVVAEAGTEEKINAVEARTEEKINAVEAKTEEKINAVEAKTEEKINAIEAEIRIRENAASADGARILEFPVIVKPVDRAGSIGISICHDKESLKTARAYALSLSASKKTIIEKFMEDCSEFNAYYMIQGGTAILSATADKINSKKEQGEKIVPNAEVYPSRYQQDFLEKVHPAMKRMIEGQNIRNGCIFLTGFVDADREFYFFETGFRLSTELSYYYIKSKCRYDALDLVLHASFSEDTSNLDLSDISEKRNDTAGATLYCYTKPGRIQFIRCELSGEVKQQVNGMARYMREGELAEEKDSTYHNAITGCIHASDKAELGRLVEAYNSQVQIMDEQGESLVYDRLQPEDII